MKKIISAILAATMCFSFSTAFAAEEEKAVYVSPEGSDSNDGSMESPLLTLKGASDKAAELGGGVTVYFREGEYRFTESVYLNKDAQDVTYMAYGNEKPVFTGGYKVPSSEFSDITLNNGVTVKSFNIKAFLEEKLGTSLSDYSPYFYPLTRDSYSQTSSEYLGRPIYSVDREPAMWLARYPNKKDGFYDENPHTVFLKAKKTENDTEKATFGYSDEHISTLAGVEDIWYSGFPQNKFFSMESKIEKIDPETKTIRTVATSSDGFKDGRDFFIENALSELDEKGEFYVSRDGIFYMYPTEFSYLNVSVLNADYMIYSNGASNVVFKGITFENTRKSGILISGGENFRVEECDFYNLSGNAVSVGAENGGYYTPFADSKWTDQFPDRTDRQGNIAKQIEKRSTAAYSTAQRGKNHGIYGCKIMNTGLSAVVTSGGSLYRDEDSGYYVENCDISFAGANKRTYEGAIRNGNTHGVTIKNNTLSHCPSTMINGYITKGVIENNEIYDALSESYDMGVIYLNYICPTLDLTIKNNYFHDVPNEYSKEEATTKGSERSAIAFDNVYGSGAKITNNLFRNMQRGVMLYTGMTFENNIFIDVLDPVYTKDMNALKSWSLSKIENADYSDFFSDANSAMYSGGLSYMELWPIFEEGERGDATRALWNEKYPEVTKWVEIVQNQYHKGKYYFKAKNNLFVNSCGEWWVSHIRMGDVYTASSDDLKGIYEAINKNNIYRTNTECFKDYENGDYSLTYSARIRYGIDEIDLTKVGAK